MTALARRISETPMAPYADMLRSMKPQEMRIVVTFLQEAMKEAESKSSKEGKSLVERVREKYGLKESDSTKWLRELVDIRKEWNPLEAWNQLSDSQRERARQWNLSAEDMDERTFAIIEKHKFKTITSCNNIFCKHICSIFCNTNLVF